MSIKNEVERIIIKAILEGKGDKVFGFINSSEYFSNDAKRIFEVCQNIYTSNGSMEYFKIYVSLKDAGDRNLLQAISDEPKYSTYESIQDFCFKLIESHTSDSLKTLCTSTINRLGNQEDVFDILESFTAFKSIFDEKMNALKPFRLEQEVKVVMDELREMALGNFTGTVRTGFYQVDDVLGSFSKGSLNLLAARPAMGKTAVALQILFNNIFNDGKRVLMFSLEMKNAELIKRMLTNYTNTNNDLLNKGFYQDISKFEDFEQKAESFQSQNVYLSDSDMTIGAIMAKTTALANAGKIDFVIIDYLQIIATDAAHGKTTKNEDVGFISRQLKMLAMNCSIPILCLSQLSRAVESRGGDKMPMLSDLRDSGSLEQDADSVSFLHRPEYYNIMVDSEGQSTEGKINWLVRKNRKGATNRDIPLFGKLSTGKIETWKEDNGNPFAKVVEERKYQQKDADPDFF
jgi:replicative DNA helicase